MARGHKICLTGFFLLLIAAVPLTQAGLEIYRGDRPQFFDGLLVVPTEANLRDFEAELEESSWVARTVRLQMQRLRFVLFHDPGPKALYGRDGWLFYKPGVDYLTQTAAEQANETEPNNGPQAALAAIVDFRDQLAERGIHLLLVPVPGKASVYPDKLTRRTLAGDRKFQSRTQGLIEALRRHNVQTVDLFDLFRQLREADRRLTDTLYLQRDTHWSGSGLRAAAAAIAGRIKGLGWLETGADETQYDLKPVTVHRQGDILNMVDVPHLKRVYPAEEVVCQQIVQNGSGALYVDNPSSPVLLLGDSFARIYQRDEPGSAGLIAHLARELAMPLSSVVNDGGASTLLRQELSRRPDLLGGKKLVIWEFVERDIRYGTEGWQMVALSAVKPQSSAADE